MTFQPFAHWCEVHAVDHPGELTVRYLIEVRERHAHKVIQLRCCNAIAVALGLTTRDVIPTPEEVVH